MSLLNNIKRNFKRDQLGSYPISKLFIPYKYRRRWAYRKMLRGSSAKEKFSEIYKKNFWGSTESISGGGSEIVFTERLREWLVSAIPKYKIRRFVDAPCGDFNWMQHVLPDVDVEYFGFDIVDSVIVENARKHSTDSVHFAVADICSDELPPCDLLMVRDCLFHLSYEDIDRFLKNLSGIDYRYLLTSTHIVDPTFRNSDIATGHFRKIDLFNDPFQFREDSVLERIDDYPSGSKSPREMLLLEKVNVPTSLVVSV